MTHRRVLLVTPYYAPAYYFGGPVRVTEAVARAVLDAGHELTVTTTDALDATSRVAAGTPAVPPGARVIRFPNLHHGLAANAMGWTPRGLRGWLREHVAGFDVVHLNDLYSVLSVAAARAARHAGVPYVVQPHGSSGLSPERGRPLVKRAFLAAWGRRTLAEASATLAGTATERADLIGAGADPARVVAIPPVLELPEPQGGPPSLPEVPTVAFVGRLDRIKGLDRLLDAVALVPGLRVVVAGDGPLRGSLEAQATRLSIDAVFPGFVDGDGKAALLGGTHVFALLSRSEGLPVAALEAMACGTPVVLSAGCNLPEVHDRAGLVVPGDAASAAAALARITGDAGLRAELSAGARAFADAYRPEVVLPRLLQLYEDCAGQRDRRIP